MLQRIEQLMQEIAALQTKNAQEADNTFNKGKETVLNESNPEGTVVLSEGNVLRIEYSSIIMTKGNAFSFD